MAIKKFRHKGLKRFFEDGNKSGIQPGHATKIGLILDLLDGAIDPKDMDFPGSNFHPLKGTFKDFYSVHVNGNWTIIFKFENGDAIEVNLLDYH
ncbi:MAG TPA: type II toxin-antitoxin system RelE/ParE family toxin [Parachlamydiaceae bacterium]|nr:type II toxin-antitoxin system RelE/ParE family toxin [Parachlamydiaceae bacterium]